MSGSIIAWLRRALGSVVVDRPSARMEGRATVLDGTVELPFSGGRALLAAWVIEESTSIDSTSFTWHELTGGQEGSAFVVDDGGGAVRVSDGEIDTGWGRPTWEAKFSWGQDVPIPVRDRLVAAGYDPKVTAPALRAREWAIRDGDRVVAEGMLDRSPPGARPKTLLRAARVRRVAA